MKVWLEKLTAFACLKQIEVLGIWVAGRVMQVQVKGLLLAAK